MKKIILLIIFFGINVLNAQQFYNVYPSKLDIANYTTTDVLELNNAYYKLEIETNDTNNFHSSLRIIKTNANGNIIWSKRYDAGTDSTLFAVSINKTLDNKIIVNSVLANDNALAPMGVSLMKVDTSGAVLWSTLFWGFYGAAYSKNVIQLSDSSYVFSAETIPSIKPSMIKYNSRASFASGKKFQNTVYTGNNPTTSISLNSNKFSISFNDGEFITTDTALNVLTDKAYNLDGSGPYFIHAVMSNGDVVFVDDIKEGGLLSGVCRVFRTDSIGNLIWAKDLTIWKNFTNHTPFDLYDITGAVNVFEDTTGRIVIHLLDEEGMGLAITFDANGNYITNKVILATQMKLCNNGDFVFVSNTGLPNTPGILAKQKHYTNSNCDSLLDVIVSGGTDSAFAGSVATNDTAIPVSFINFPVHVTNTSVTPTVYCTITGINEVQESNNSGIIAYPDPAVNCLSVILPDNLSKSEIRIYNLTGQLLLKTILTNRESIIDISSLSDGVYILQATKGDNISRRKFVKQ
jgi:hypothetical protein